MRNQETSSPFVRTIPKATPANRYAGSRRSRARPAVVVIGATVVIVSPHDERGQEEMARERAAREEGEHRDQRRQLQVRQPGDPVARGAAASVGGAEPGQEPAADQEEQSPDAQHDVPVEHLSRDEPREIVDAEARERRHRRAGDGCRIRVREQHAADEPADDGPEHEDEIPQPHPLPVVLEEIRAPRQAGGAQVPQVARDAERLVADEEQADGDEPHQGTRDVPGPGTVQELANHTEPSSASSPSSSSTTVSTQICASCRVERKFVAELPTLALSILAVPATNRESWEPRDRGGCSNHDPMNYR